MRMRALRDRLRSGLEAKLDEVFINGSMEHRLPNNLNMSFAYVEGESLLMGINDIAVSSGSACTSATLEPSYVLKALGVGEDLAHTSIRFGLGRFNTEEEVDYVIDKMVQVVTKLRELSPAVRNGQGRHRHLQDEVAGSVQLDGILKAERVQTMANEGTIRIHRSIGGTGAAFRVTFVPYGGEGEDARPPVNARFTKCSRFAPS